MHSSIRYRLLVPLALLALALPTVARAEGITAEMVKKAQAEVVPRVSKETGVALDEVTFRIGDAKEIAAALRRELLPQMRVQTETEEAAVEEAARMAETLSASLYAKYIPKERAIVVCPETVDRIATLCDLPVLRSYAVLRAVLVHESVHAADDLTYDLVKMMSAVKSVDEITAYNAVIEGHAQHVARKICADAGWSEGFEAFTSAIGALPDEKDEAVLFMMRLVAATMTTAYYDGETFIRTLAERGGRDAVRKAWTTPPKEAEIIFNPEWFLDPSKRIRASYDFDKALDAVEPAVEGSWTATRVAITPPQLRAAMSLLPADVIDRVAKSLKHNRTLVLSSDDTPGWMILTMVSEFSNAAEAAYYVAASERLIRLKDEKMTGSDSLQIVSADYKTVTGSVWSGLLYAKSLKVSGTPLTANGLVGARGNVGIELTVVGADVPEKKMIELADEVLRRLTAPK